MDRRRRASSGLVISIALAALLTVPASTQAARGLDLGIYDVGFTASDAATRTALLDRTARAAGSVLLYADWRTIAPANPPRGFDPSNPRDPSYSWGPLDGAVREARARRLKVAIDVTSAPDWAEGRNVPGNADPGSWRPSVGKLAKFATAVVKRYSGQVGGLPRIRDWGLWAEPNLELNLAPQWRHGKPSAPAHYRAMLNAYYRSVKAVSRRNTVFTGGTAPYGDPPGGARMQPALFLRTLLCLNARLGPTKCKRPAHLDVLSHNSITSPLVHAGPDHVPAHGDIEASNFGEVRRILHAAERTKRVRPAGHHAIWSTEFWWFSNPPNPYGVSPAKQARYIEKTLYLDWKGGASRAFYFQIQDDVFHPGSPLSTFQTGLYFHSGKPKPSFRSFRFPFVTHRTSKHGIGVWGKAPRGGKLKIERRRNGGWRTVKRLHVHRGQVFTSAVGLHGSGRLRGQVGGLTSLPWHQR